MADALWEGHTLLKTGLSAHRHTQTDRQTDCHRQTKVKTMYSPVSLCVHFEDIMTIAYNSAYVQTETFKFTFARQAVIVYFDAER